MEKVKPPRPPINWLKLLFAAVWPLLGLVLLHLTVVPPDFEWLLWGKWVLGAIFVLLVRPAHSGNHSPLQTKMRLLRHSRLSPRALLRSVSPLRSPI